MSYVNVCRDAKIGEDKLEWTELMVNTTILPDCGVRVSDESEVPDDIVEADRAIIEKGVYAPNCITFKGFDFRD